MKGFIPILFLPLPCAVFAQLPTSGLVAWYPFCGNANDYSGNGYNLTDSGATLTTDRANPVIEPIVLAFMRSKESLTECRVSGAITKSREMSVQ